MHFNFKKETYSQKVVDIIRKMIREGELEPGATVKETAIMKFLGISRAPIREALQELVCEGVVVSEPQRGKRVRRLTAKDIQDSYAVGGLLEAVGVSESLHAWNPDEFGILETITENMRLVSERGQGMSPMMPLDDQFHETLLTHCANRHLVRLARRSCMPISKVLCYRKWQTIFSCEEFYERHVTIITALQTRDASVVSRALREHYQEIGDRMVHGMD